MTALDYAADLELALRAARAAGEVVMPWFRAGAEVRFKSPDQPVTEADLAADRLLQEILLGERPDYGWLSEETRDTPARLGKERLWVVDPIDGTNSFVQGRAEFAISIALVDRRRAVVGVVYNPAAGLNTAPTTGRPRSTSATLMANSARPFTNELVPSMGSTTQSRSFSSRSGVSFVSSESPP